MAPPAGDGDLEVIRIERAATGGGVGRAYDGKVVFVRHALVGELVRVAVVERTSTFDRGDAVEVLEPSARRVVAPCRYAHPGGCGGCDLQHASLGAQHDWKAALVAEQLRRIARIEREVTVTAAPSSPRGSRTRLRCALDDRGRLGLRRSRSNDVVSLEECWIADERLVPAFARSWRGAEEVELRAIGEGEPFAVVTRTGEREHGHEVRSLSGRVLDPSTTSRVSVGGHTFAVGARSFWQAHRDAPSMLTEAVLRLADPRPGDDVVDLYSGVGLFSVPLARAVGPLGRVTAVESSLAAVADARVNAAGLRQLVVRPWSVSPRSVNDAVRPGSVVVLDPPRHGLGKGVVDALVRRSPRRVVYVSCDASTFARDLRNFLDRGFALRCLEVLDLFPMTEHVELVALLDTASQRVDSAPKAESLGSR